MTTTITITEHPENSDIYNITVQKGGTKISIDTGSSELERLYSGKTKTDVSLAFVKQLMDDNYIKCVKSYDFSTVVDEWYNQTKTLHFKKEQGAYCVHEIETDKFYFLTNSDLQGEDLWSLSEIQLKRISNKKKEALDKSIQMVQNLDFKGNNDLFDAALI